MQLVPGCTAAGRTLRAYFAVVHVVKVVAQLACLRAGITVAEAELPLRRGDHHIFHVLQHLHLLWCTRDRTTHLPHRIVAG